MGDVRQPAAAAKKEAYTNRESLSFNSKVVKEVNDLTLMRFIGECGLPMCWDSRQQILHLAYLLILFSLFCGIFSLISLTVSLHVTQVGAWTTGYGKIYDVVSVNSWVGLSGIVYQSQAGQTITESYISWEDSACYNDDVENPYCDNCNSGGNTAAGLTLLATVIRLPSIMVLKARRLTYADEPLLKVLGIFSEGLAAICFAGAMFVWSEYCMKQLPHQNSVNYSHGQGFALVALAFCMSCGIVLVHVLMPTSDPDAGDSEFAYHGLLSAKRNSTKGLALDKAGKNNTTKKSRPKTRSPNREPKGNKMSRDGGDIEAGRGGSSEVDEDGAKEEKKRDKTARTKNKHAKGESKGERQVARRSEAKQSAI
jgi:hypothetical protein